MKKYEIPLSSGETIPERKQRLVAAMSFNNGKVYYDTITHIILDGFMTGFTEAVMTEEELAQYVI